MMAGDFSYADRVLAEVSAGANGLESEALVAAIRDACGALQKQMAALNAADYGQSEHKTRCPTCTYPFKVLLAVPNLAEVARAVSHTTKAADEIYRLLAFAAGQPDSRPDLGRGNHDLHSLLTADQLTTFEAWSPPRR